MPSAVAAGPPPRPSLPVHTLDGRPMSPGRADGADSPPPAQARPWLLESVDGWARFPDCENDRVPVVRCNTSKYLASGVYRRIRGTSGSYVYIHVAEVSESADITEAVAIMQRYLNSTSAPPSEVVLSGGTLSLLDDELVMYPSEVVDTESGEQLGVLLCASRADLAERVPLAQRLEKAKAAAAEAESGAHLQEPLDDDLQLYDAPDIGESSAAPAIGESPADPGFGVSPVDPGFGESPAAPAIGGSPDAVAIGEFPDTPAVDRSPDAAASGEPPAGLSTGGSPAPPFIDEAPPAASIPGSPRSPSLSPTIPACASPEREPKRGRFGEDVQERDENAH